MIQLGIFIGINTDSKSIDDLRIYANDSDESNRVLEALIQSFENNPPGIGWIKPDVNNDGEDAF